MPSRVPLRIFALKQAVFALIFWFVVPYSGLAQARNETTHALFEDSLYYVVVQKTKYYAEQDTLIALGSLNFRETVWVLQQASRWARVRRADSSIVQVSKQALSNVWLLASKTHGKLYLYEGSRLVRTFPADFAVNPQAGIKTKRGTLEDKSQWITPEGLFYIAGKNPQSEFYKAFVLNYPRIEDAERGLATKLISPQEFRAIQEANTRFKMPPMNTKLGGMIEIHGKGSGRRINWTRGCIAIRDIYMDDLWPVIQVGTPLLIEP